MDNEGKFAGGDPVQVIVEDTGPVVAEMNTARARPCDGGFSVGHVNVTAGTFGGNVRFGANFGFILSNNHVLANVNAGTVGDNVLQPGVADGGTVQNDVIATLTRWVPIDFATGANNEVDCAIAEAVNPGDITRNVQGIGIPGALADATPQQAIRKSGRSTQLTTGTIVSDNATTRTTLGGQTAVFVNQLQYTQMTNGGDSGSLIWDQNSLTVVGLHYAGDTSNSYGNKILRVLALLSRAFTIYDVKGKATHFDEADICLLDQPKGLNKHKLKKAATPKRKSVK
ncbi:hypothetical protein V5E97_24405 [Singulisphaera sp. Ch08]|uniref:Serine protease n=1 Tax=Singulisphaera sp. Ch08 TaxID=3120278 RepID=A0AAU7C925_9BACT